MIGLKQYINEQVELENLLIEMSEEDFDSLLETLDHKELEIVEGIFGAIAKGVGAVAKGAGKLAAKGAKGAGKLAAKGAKAGAKMAVQKGKEKFTTKGKADAANKKAAKVTQKRKDAERLAKAQDVIKKERETLKKLKDREGEGGSKVAALRDKIKKMMQKKKQLEPSPA
jgi:hypothetical protein